jgi:hypothetical protein
MLTRIRGWLSRPSGARARPYRVAPRRTQAATRYLNPGGTRGSANAGRDPSPRGSRLSRQWQVRSRPPSARHGRLSSYRAIASTLIYCCSVDAGGLREGCLRWWSGAVHECPLTPWPCCSVAPASELSGECGGATRPATSMRVARRSGLAEDRRGCPYSRRPGMSTLTLRRAMRRPRRNVLLREGSTNTAPRGPTCFLRLGRARRAGRDSASLQHGHPKRGAAPGCVRERESRAPRHRSAGLRCCVGA